MKASDIKAVVDWMNAWEQLKDTAIPMRFKEDFTDPDERLLTSSYLMELHPELKDSEASSYLVFCNQNTIRFRGCYGKGEIMYPLWIEHKKQLNR